MNYIFNVLWFEDNAGWYRLQNPHWNQLYLSIVCSAISHQRGVQAFDIEELKATNYDLILMDYDLPPK